MLSISDLYAAYGKVQVQQGSEFAHTVLALPPHGSAILTRELIYTGITRASQRFTLVTPQAQVFRQGVAQPTVRASGLRQFMRVN